jgi:hypothetical protein
MKTLLILLGLTISLLAVSANAQTSAADKKAFNTFFATFKKAVAANDKNAVAMMVNFPFYDRTGEVFSDSVKSLASKNKAEFLKNYDTIFTESVKQAIAKGKPYTKVKGEDNPGGGGPEFGEFQLDNDDYNDSEDRQSPLFFKKIKGKYKLVGISYNP